MNQENTEKLYTNYPILYEQKDLDETQSAMCFGFECGDGWYKIIDELSNKIEMFNNLKVGVKITATQVKEKFGTLRFYHDFVFETEDKKLTDTIYNIVDDLITIAEWKTEHTCEVCGERGELRNDSWIRCLCEKHAKK
jgi:hypothetical protein